tara:strand:+ start:479 stop:1414 length:936 start_codon:yes stop_codon:yes gene_type:complete
MSNIFKDFDLVKGTGMKASIAGAGALFNGYQAIRARVDYGNKMTEIKNYDDSRQKITNVFGQLENPYKNLAVATQAAEIKMEQTDQALANTLDTLRETGAAAGGATAIANAALKSKQGIAASIEQQEVNNQKLQAQGQLQVDIAKGKGEIQRMQMQENRDVAKLDRLQSQADVLKAQQQSATLGAIQGLTNVGDVLVGGMTAADLKEKETDDAIVKNVNSPKNSGFGIKKTTPESIAAKEREDEEYVKQQMARKTSKESSYPSYTGDLTGLMTDEGKLQNNDQSNTFFGTWDESNQLSNAEYEEFLKNTSL